MEHSLNQFPFFISISSAVRDSSSGFAAQLQAYIASSWRQWGKGKGVDSHLPSGLPSAWL